MEAKKRGNTGNVEKAVCPVVNPTSKRNRRLGKGGGFKGGDRRGEESPVK